MNEIIKNLVYNTFPDSLCAAILEGIAEMHNNEKLMHVIECNTFKDRADTYISFEVDHVVWGVIVEQDLDDDSLADFLNQFIKQKPKQHDSVYYQISEAFYNEVKDKTCQNA